MVMLKDSFYIEVKVGVDHPEEPQKPTFMMHEPLPIGIRAMGEIPSYLA